MKPTALLSFASLTAAVVAAETEHVLWTGAQAEIPVSEIEADDVGIAVTSAADLGLTAQWEATRTGSEVRVDLLLTNIRPQEQRLAVGRLESVDAQTRRPVIVPWALEDTRMPLSRGGVRLDYAHLRQGVPHRVTWRIRTTQGAAQWRIRVPLHTAEGYRLIGTEVQVPEDTSGLGPSLLPQLLAVIAAKTGNPVEMLTADMQLAEDLGLDSIMLVEILLELEEAAPQASAVPPDKLGKLRTIADVVGALSEAEPPMRLFPKSRGWVSGNDRGLARMAGGLFQVSAASDPELVAIRDAYDPWLKELIIGVPPHVVQR